MKMTTNLTPMGTFLYDDDGEQMRNVVSVQRMGKKVYVTTCVRDMEVEGVEGDFHLGVNGSFQPVRA